MSADSPVDVVARNQRIIALAQLARLALFLGTTALLGRLLGTADFGFVAVVSTVFLVTTELLDVGTSSVATRRIVQRVDEEPATLSALEAWRRLVASAIGLVVAIVACLPGSTFTGPQRAVLLVAAAVLPAMSLNTYHVVFQTRQAFARAVAIGLVVQAGFVVALGALLVGVRDGWLGAVAVGPAAASLVVFRELAQVLGSRFVALRLLGRSLVAPVGLREVSALLRDCGPFGLGALAYRLSGLCGPLLVWVFGAPETSGRFYAAFRLIGPLTDVAWSIATPLVAAFSAAALDDPAAARSRLASTLGVQARIAVLIAVAGPFVVPTALRLFYGARYVDGADSAVPTLRWLCLAAAFVVVTPTLAASCLARGRDAFLAAVASGALGVGLVGNALLVPALGPAGAAIVLCVSEALVTVALLADVVRRTGFEPGPGWLAAVLLPAAVAAALLPLLDAWPMLQLLACAGSCLLVPLSSRSGRFLERRLARETGRCTP